MNRFSMLPFAIIFFLFSPSGYSSIPDGYNIIGLYPFGETGGTNETLLYRSDPIQLSLSHKIAPILRQNALPDEITNFKIGSLGVSSGGTDDDMVHRLTATVQYTGTEPYTAEQLHALFPQVWLVALPDIEPVPVNPQPSLLSRLLGATPPKRNQNRLDAPVNFVMVMVDTLRADHTQPYGHPFISTAHIDMLSAFGITFTNAYGASCSTRPSVGTMFTGVQPWAHGAVRHSLVGASLHPKIPLLAESFKTNGYTTVGVSANAQVTKAFGFDRGFDTYDCPVRETKVTTTGLEHLQTLNEPFFLYLHYMAPHAPYEPPAPYHGMYSGKNQREEQDRYCEEIAYEDQNIGSILKELTRQGLLDRTIIWLVSDHGEEFWEHGWNGHGAKLYEESVRTASIISSPRRFSTKKRHDFTAAHADIFPTLLDFYGWEKPVFLQGTSLLPWFYDENVPPTAIRPVFLHHGGGLDPGRHISDKDAVVDSNEKLIWSNQKDEWELYDLTTDSLEKENLADVRQDTKENLKAELLAHLEECEKIAGFYSASDSEDQTNPLSEQDLENMRTYNYIE